MGDRNTFNSEFLKFLSRSPSPFHAVRSMAEKLKAAGFTELKEQDAWKVAPGAKHFVVKNESSVVAFQLGSRPLAESGFRIVAAHSDSPCLRVKPNPELGTHGVARLGVEVYGSPILSTWFDRDLSLAGRLVGKTSTGALVSELINFEKPVAIVPNLAIHLNRLVNKERSINEQQELPAIWAQAERSKGFKSLLLDMAKTANSAFAEVLDFELSFYDVQPPQQLGLSEEFIASARLDNLASCYVGLTAFLDSPSDTAKVFVAFDHEEVGSRSHSGAQSSFLSNLLLRLCGSVEDRARALSRSLLVSADNAHAIHPNYPEKMEPMHAPRLNAGPVIKLNSNQSYATNARSSSILIRCAEQAKVATQRFVIRTDMACGSTVGPIVAAQLGIETVDVGIPQWAMHSCRETMGSEDAHSLRRILQVFYSVADLDGK